MSNSSYNRKPWSPLPEKENQNQSKSRRARGQKSFADDLKTTADTMYRVTNPKVSMKRTENGALEYGTTGKALLDIHYQLSSLRGKSESVILDMWRNAYLENPSLAIRWLFWSVDIREGAGERRTFQVIIKDMIQHGGDGIVAKLVPIIPEFNRWDMLYTLLEVKSGKVYQAVKATIRLQWEQDLNDMYDGKPISLMAKWLKSANSHTPETRLWGIKTAEMLDITEVVYRKTLSKLRKYLDVVERKMSSHNWQAIDYEKVPSKANLNYNKAFLRNDEERRRKYLEALDKGQANINSSTLFPHEIVHKYVTSTSFYCGARLRGEDITLENLWSHLPNLITKDTNTLVVCDGSGSMWQPAPGAGGKSPIQVEEVAYALSIYFAQHNKGFYHDKVMTFSSKPQLFDIGSLDNSLYNALQKMMEHTECSNTNIEAVFKLILRTAVVYGHRQEDLPESLIIVSDGEWDSMTRNNSYSTFEAISKEFKNHGYTLPKLIFWNVANRSATMPFNENSSEKFPCILVSGFSTNIFKMVLSDKTSPWEALVDTIMDKRYNLVEYLAFKKSSSRSSGKTASKNIGKNISKNINTKSTSVKKDTSIKKTSVRKTPVRKTAKAGRGTSTSVKKPRGSKQ